MGGLFTLKNIYLIQAGELFSEGDYKSAYIPYAVGAIAAYAWADETIRNEYFLGRFIFYREKIDDVVNSLDTPFLVGFSNYVWNFSYNKALAQAIKSAYPDCIIVFGGPQIDSSTKLLHECTYIDFLTSGEGEASFKALLLELLDAKNFDSVPNISYRNNKGTLTQNSFKSENSLDFPSPYLSGIFDSLFTDNNIKFIAVIETNRGCPYKCAYCSCYSTKEKDYTLKMVPIQRVFEEIEWIAHKRIEYCLCADSNFGISDRDEQIVDHVIDINKKTGYPLIFNTAFAKEKNESIFKIVIKLHNAGMLKELTLSFQSLSPDVIKTIKRKNMSIEIFSKLMKKYQKIGIHPYTELILGLPDETYESFRDGFQSLIEAGQKHYIHVWLCFVLANSPMAAKEFMERYGIKTVDSPSNLYHSKPDSNSEPSGYSQIVVSTNTMDEKMWIKSYLFSAYIQSMFFMGALRQISIYLFHEKQLKHTSFIEDFISWSAKHPETICGKIYATFYKIFSDFLKGDAMLSYFNPTFGDITWYAEEGIFLETVYHIEEFFRDIELFISSYDLPEDVAKDLIRYQINMINIPGRDRIEFNLNYDFDSYFSAISDNGYKHLRKIKNNAAITNSKSYDNWNDYAREIVWFGRKIGRTYFSKSNSDIAVKYEN